MLRTGVVSACIPSCDQFPEPRSCMGGESKLPKQCHLEERECDSEGSCPSFRHGACDPEQGGPEEEAGIHRAHPRVAQGSAQCGDVAVHVLGQDQRDLPDVEAEERIGPTPSGLEARDGGNIAQLLHRFYIEKVAVYYLRDMDNHWKDWTKSRLILEIEMFEADVLEELSLTGTTAAPNMEAAASGSNPRPLAPQCPDCGVEMIERTNRITQNKFWGCRLFPTCKKTYPLLIDGKPTAVVMSALEKQSRKSPTKEVKEEGSANPGGYEKPLDPSATASQASWESVDPMATSAEVKGERQFNINVSEAEMKALSERRKTKWGVKSAQ